MTVRSLPWLALAMLCVVAASAALAEPQRPPPRERPAQQQPQRPAASNPCAVFGPGFVRMAGSDTCIKLGGATSIGGGVGGY
ncbi:hypothetical protein BJ122_101143 [Rhodopseudomonas faecalis]|uniref:Porin n=1 Tax=Rhodopseudomonas faecalis TaxID=99655 RepID=A0A318TL85_9BRAD|nr:hypothetical protein [Rhodopseudomonas faecalis]PYF05404.1 hypothetical protein BJ122_101143 [Rhodopseudomonas faecalis]TAH67402.1 MAG: hypothetical protein EWM45_07620 [Rhodopseudomonas palustris]